MEDPYLEHLAQLLSGGQSQPMAAPAIMPVNIRPLQPFSPGPAGPTKDQIKDAERDQLISTIGTAVSGIAGSYGQANATGAYAPGMPLGAPAGGAAGGAPAAGAPATGAPATAAATQKQFVPVDYGRPGPQTNAALNSFPTQQTNTGPRVSDPGVYPENAAITRTSPTGASAIQHPAITSLIQQIASGGSPQMSVDADPSSSKRTSSERFNEPPGLPPGAKMSDEDIWQLYGGGSAVGAMPNPVQTGGTYPISGGRIGAPESRRYSFGVGQGGY